MTTIRPKTALGLALALCLGATALLLRPLPVQSAPSKSARFVFGPVFAPQDSDIEVVVTNTGARPSPPFHVVISNAITGATLATHDTAALAPGHGDIATVNAPVSVRAVAVVTFAAPAPGQAVPKPLAVTMEILGSTGTIDAVLNPQPSPGK